LDLLDRAVGIDAHRIGDVLVLPDHPIDHEIAARGHAPDVRAGAGERRAREDGTLGLLGRKIDGRLGRHRYQNGRRSGQEWGPPHHICLSIGCRSIGCVLCARLSLRPCDWPRFTWPRATWRTPSWPHLWCLPWPQTECPF